MRTTTLISSLDNQLEKVYEDYQDAFGFGPCGAYATIRREHGWGQVATCIAHSVDGTEFSHYIVLDGSAIIDLSNPFDEELTYTDIELLADDELPDMVSKEALSWMRERIDESEE